MKIRATNALEASKEILRVIIASDYKYARHKGSQYGFVYVYFSPEFCRFTFEMQQRKHSTEMIKQYTVVNLDEVVHITACKYGFSQIAIGATLSRKIMSPIEFFAIAKEHFEWM